MQLLSVTYTEMSHFSSAPSVQGTHVTSAHEYAGHRPFITILVKEWKVIAFSILKFLSTEHFNLLIWALLIHQAIDSSITSA